MESAPVEQSNGFGSVTHEGITIQSNDETPDQIRTALSIEPESPAAPAADAKPGPDETSERNTDGTFKKRNRRDDPQEAVKAAVAKQREAERRAEDAERRLAAQAQPRQQPPPATAQAAQQQPATDAEPQEADFPDYRSYVKAQARWEARQEFTERETQRTEQAQRQQREHDTRTLDATWQGRLAEAKEQTPDLIASINPETPLSAPMMHVIKESTVGVQLLKHLSDHQDVAQRLSTLHPAQALREMGKLEARLEAASEGRPAPIVPAISNAKAPLKRLETSHVTGSDSAPSDDDSDEVYFAKKAALKAKKRS